MNCVGWLLVWYLFAVGQCVCMRILSLLGAERLCFCDSESGNISDNKQLCIHQIAQCIAIYGMKYIFHKNIRSKWNISRELDQNAEHMTNELLTAIVCSSGMSSTDFLILMANFQRNVMIWLKTNKLSWNNYDELLLLWLLFSISKRRRLKCIAQCHITTTPSLPDM